MNDYEPDWSLPLASSGVVDVSAAQPGGQGTAGIPGTDSDGGSQGLAHGSWDCIAETEDDSDGFSTPGWYALNRVTGKTRILNCSRFHFHMTEARWRWLVEHNFPASPGRGPWTDEAIDAAMEDGA